MKAVVEMKVVLSTHGPGGGVPCEPCRVAITVLRRIPKYYVVR